MSKRRDAMRDMLTPIGADGARPSRTAMQSGALLSMNRAFESLTQDAEAAEILRAQIAAGATVIDIAPEDIEPSIVKDRLDGFETEDFAALQDSLEMHGQILPVLVRPHPEHRNRYQLAFGHRRVEALRRLNRRVKAVVRALDDDALIIAQGKENLERKDLSFIERAMFALRLEERGVKRETIMAALCLHKGNLSTMISLVRRIPEALIVSIGPAPRIGRPRWEQLADNLASSPFDWLALIASDEYRKLESDARFECLLQKSAPRAENSTRASPIASSNGVDFAEVTRTGRKTRLVIDDRAAPDFASYLVARLPELLDAFHAHRRTD